MTENKGKRTEVTEGEHMIDSVCETKWLSVSDCIDKTISFSKVKILLITYQ